MIRSRRAAWLALAALLMPAAVARADDSLDPRIRLALTTVSEGLEATISLPGLAHLAPLLNVRNTTGKTLTIVDDTGTPFLRTGGGVVEGNVRSAFLGAALAPNAPASPSPGGPEPLWKKIGTGNALRWYDVRAAYDGHGPDDATAAATLKRFTIPALLGEESATIDGEVTWKPILGRIEAAFESVAPPDPKISVRVVAGTLPAIQLTNASGRTIEITGRDDKPFARIGPGGITVNVNSPTYRDTRTQPEAAPDAEPDWQPQNAAVLV